MSQVDLPCREMQPLCNSVGHPKDDMLKILNKLHII